MSEKLTLNHEQFETLLEAPERKALPDAEHAEPLRPGEADPAQTLQEARKHVAEQAQAIIPSRIAEQLHGAENAPQMATPQTINRDLKQITLTRELQQLQRKLPAVQRRLSKVIHRPVVRAVSEAAGKTISRPSGLLGGGLVALAGTSAYLYLAKHIGFTYNYSVFLLLFVGGFALGLVLELVVHLFMKPRQADS